MENRRLQPYRGRRRYRSWMTEANGVPPRSTLDRMRRREAACNREPEEPEEVPPFRPGGNYWPDGPWFAGWPRPLVQLDDLIEPAEANIVAEQLEPVRPVSPPTEDNDSNAGSLQNEVSSSSEHSARSDTEDDSAAESDSGDSDEDEANVGPQRFPSLDEPLFPGSDCSKFECLLMIINFSLRHGLSQVATEDLCCMVNSILRGDYLPASKHMLKKIFGQAGFHLNFYCRQCESFIVAKSNHAKMQGVHVCDVCELECNLANMNDNHFFVTFSVKQQLKFLLESTENAKELLHYRHRRILNPNVISDIYDGKIYSQLSKDGEFLSPSINNYNISLTINTDGAMVFDSSKNTLWPLFFRINEFPPTVRFNFSNCLLGGLWFAKSEPNMTLFLSTFVRELNNLYENGFVWKARTGENISSKVIVLQCVADSKAKPLVQNCKTHNGYYGCGFCLHPGVMYEGSSQAKYPMDDNLVLMVDSSFSYTVDGIDPQTKEEKTFAIQDRKDTEMRQTMELAEINRNARGEGDIKGVKGLRIATVDKRLLSIRPPVTISRRPRKMSDRQKWHGNEWRNWLLYYSLPCMDGIIPSRYLKHHCLLVSAIYLLLQDHITDDDVERATRYLGTYCTEFANLYGESLMYFNVHLLLHLGKCVALHGPLFCFSAFSFEGANGTLVNLVKGSRGVLNQIAHKYNMCKVMPTVVEKYNVNEATLKYCLDIMSYQPVKVAYQYNTITALGEQKHFPLNDDELQALEESGQNVTPSSYERMIIRNVMYHARCYKRKGEKSDSSVVQLKSGKFGCIERIIDPANFREPAEPNLLILLRDINVLRDPIVMHPSGARAEHIVKCAPVVYGDLRVITAADILKLAILMNCTERSFLTTFPNMYEKD